jgi:hypothetical protein
MARRRRGNLTIEEVQASFDQWRKSRRGRSPIPDELWAAAGELARRHGVNRISRALRLEFNHLKRRAESSGRISATRADKTPAFLELVNPGASDARIHDRDRWSQRHTANPARCNRSRRRGVEPGSVERGLLIQIAPQFRILVAIDAIDGRKYAASIDMRRMVPTRIAGPSRGSGRRITGATA